MSIKIVRPKNAIEIYQKVKNAYMEIASRQTAFAENPEMTQKYFMAYMLGHPGLSVTDAMGEMSSEFHSNYGIAEVLPDAKVISCEYASVVDAIASARLHVSQLDYALPFPVIFLHLQKPLEITLHGSQERIVALLLEQRVITKEILSHWDKSKNKFQNEILGSASKIFDRNKLKSLLPRINSSLAIVQPSIRKKIEAGENILTNCVSAIYDDMCQTHFGWNSGSQFELTYDESATEGSEEVRQLHMQLKQIAVAVVGFINCENVEIEKCFSPGSYAKNTKKKNSKPKREYYYVCKIVKNFEPPAGEPQTINSGNLGSHHSFRYDVRGHFRRLSSGKTIWVKPHLRGLENENYIPKQYSVDSE